MTIIKIEPLETGLHPIESQSHRRTCWLPGYIDVPPGLEQAALASGGWCDLTVEGGRLVSITPTEKPVVESEPTTDELMNILLGVMTDG